MTDELDLDAFTLDAIELDPAPPPPAPERRVDEAARAAIAAERAAMEQMTMEGPAVPVAKDVTPVRDKLRALVYASRSGGDPHVVSLHETKDGKAVLCICDAMMSLARRPQGCWAMVDGREVFGLAPIGGEDVGPS